MNMNGSNQPANNKWVKPVAGQVSATGKGLQGIVKPVTASEVVSKHNVGKVDTSEAEKAERKAKIQSNLKKVGEVAEQTTKGIAQLGSAVASALPGQEALNANDSARSGMAQGVGNMLMQSGNIWGMLAGTAIQLGDKLGLTSRGSTNGSTLENIGNMVGGIIPGSKFFATEVAGLDVNQRVASSRGYSGVAEAVKKAKEDAGGSFLFGANKINNIIQKAALAQERASANLEKADLAAQAANSPLQGMRTQMQMSGGYNPLVAKEGSKLYNLSDIRSLIDRGTRKLQEGGSIGQPMSLDEIAQKLDQEMPNFWWRTKHWPTWITWQDSKGNTLAGAHELQWDTDDNGRAVVFPMIQDIDGQLVKFDDWQEAKKSAISRGDFVNLSEDEASLFVDRYESLVPEYFYEPYDEDFNAFMHTLPLNQRYTSRDKYDTKRAWELIGKPETFQQAVDAGVYELQPDGYHGSSVVLNNDTGEYEFMKSSDHPTLWMEEAFYNGFSPEIKWHADPESTNYMDYDIIPLEGDALQNSVAFKNAYKLDKSGPRWKYVPKEGNQGIESFKSGGSFNVIPSGALHKNKHHLTDIDEKFKEVTHKGIPVITEDEGGTITQHAEVEKEEIIFRYDVTKKLEKLMKEETDEAAVEAGKLLTEEILYNTIDNTKNLL